MVWYGTAQQQLNTMRCVQRSLLLQSSPNAALLWPRSVVWADHVKTSRTGHSIPPRALPPHRALPWVITSDYWWLLMILTDYTSQVYMSQDHPLQFELKIEVFMRLLLISLKLLVAIGGTATKNPDQRCYSFSISSILTPTWKAKCEKLESACFWPRAHGWILRIRRKPLVFQANSQSWWFLLGNHSKIIENSEKARITR